MKRVICILLAVLMLLPALSSCEAVFEALWYGVERDDSFDEAKEGILRVMKRDSRTGEVTYDVIGTGRRRKSTEPFEPEPMTVLKAAGGCFDLMKIGTGENQCVKVKVMDENGEEAEVTPEIEAIFHEVGEIPHAVFALRILLCGGRTFAVVELNVNWSDPVYLYEAGEDGLTELYQYDNKEILGLAAVKIDE